MSNETFTNEISVKCYNDKEGVFIEVQPDLESNCIRLLTTTKASEEWFGKIDVSFSKEMAEHLIQAINFVAKSNNWEF